MGKMLTCLPGLSLPQLRPMLRSTTGLCTCRRDSKFPIAPMGKLLTCLPFDSRLHNCERFGNLQMVRAAETLKSSHRPMGELLTCLPDSRLHNCERFGQLQDVRATETLKTSHRPRWDFHICFAHVFAGWRCLRPGWHGDLVIVHHHWQHSCSSACSRSKFPIAPMGKLRPDGRLTMFAR
jgi:hypothetical protein